MNNTRGYFIVFEGCDGCGKTTQTERLRAAVAEYLATPNGKQAIIDTNYDFNWGDAISSVPDEIWNKYGLSLVEDDRETIDLDQDEILCPEEE